MPVAALKSLYQRYVGEPVAAVFAADPYVAEDASDLVDLDIEALPVVLDAAGPPGAFDEHHDTDELRIDGVERLRPLDHRVIAEIVPMRRSSCMNSLSALSVTAVWTDAAAVNGPGCGRMLNIELAP